MIDLYFLKLHTTYVIQKLKEKGFDLNIQKFNNINNNRKIIQVQIEYLRSDYKRLSKVIGELKNHQKNCEILKLKVLKVKNHLTNMIQKFNTIAEEIKKFISNIPNIPDDTVPIGKKYENNKIIKYWGHIKKNNFNIKDHVELGKNINGFDWFAANVMSGSRFVVINDKLALLYRALGQFMLDIHTVNHGYLETYIPYLVNYDSMYGAGQLPKFKNELFYVSKNVKHTKNYQYILIPTAEVPLTNLFKNSIIPEKELPIMLTAYSPCFRAENISYGQDSRGLIRMYQFDKVEIFQITSPENSMYTLEQITLHAEKILQLLNLPYRKVLLCTGDMSFASSKTYDLEVWFPAQNNYREISSCSNMIDFQSRRLNIKFLQNNTKKKHFVHTLNGSGLAIGRTLAAVMENYQCSDGTIKIPKILQKYMHGIEFIK